jgi:hypothetical protein
MPRLDERYIHPEHLVIGKRYTLYDEGDGQHPYRFCQVTLLAYDVCPAFVIIQSESGKLRCLRQGLLDSPESPPNSP